MYYYCNSSTLIRTEYISPSCPIINRDTRGRNTTGNTSSTCTSIYNVRTHTSANY